MASDITVDHYVLEEIADTDLAVEYTQDNEYGTILNDREIWYDFTEMDNGSSREIFTIIFRAQYVSYPEFYIEHQLQFNIKNCAYQNIYEDPDFNKFSDEYIMVGD